MNLVDLNSLPSDRARDEFLRCCGSRRWADLMVFQRPFKNKEAVLSSADAVWAKTDEIDWLEAFAQHPRIGGKDALRAKFSATSDWAKNEQSSVAAADEAVLDALARGNVEYEAKFGYIFIVCATGKSAAAMLDLLKSRLGNDPKTEKRIAAGEQAKITKIRLEKLLS